MPKLLASMWFARCGVLVGLPIWPGALLYALYNYLFPLFCIPFTPAHPLHLSIVTASLYTSVALIAATDATAVRKQLSGTVPEKAGASVLVLLGVLSFTHAAGALAEALCEGSLFDATALAISVADLPIAPACIIGGMLPWRRAPLGYVTGLPLLFLASMLFLGLIALIILQPLVGGAGFVSTDLLVVSGRDYSASFIRPLRARSRDGAPVVMTVFSRSLIDPNSFTPGER